MTVYTEDTRPGEATKISRFFTPLAILLVINGIILGDPGSPAKGLAVGLLAFSILFNFFGVRWIGRAPAMWKVYLRMTVNVGVNVVLVYLLGASWPAIWLLLLLSPIAAALYGSQNMTISLSAFSAAVLLAIAWSHGVRSPIALAEIGTRGLFIILVSLAVYELANDIKSPS